MQRPRLVDRLTHEAVALAEAASCYGKSTLVVDVVSTGERRKVRTAEELIASLLDLRRDL